jgi:hypothetical protein
MAVVAVNQQQFVNASQFVATFTGVAFDDALLVCFPDGTNIVFNSANSPEFLKSLPGSGTEVRMVISLDKVPEHVAEFSFQIRAANSFARAWTLADPSGSENYQNYATPIDSGKTSELLEFGRVGERWFVRTKNEAIGETPLPAEQSMYPEHLRELALAARWVASPEWKNVEAFVEVNEVVASTLGTQLYLDTLSAIQAIAAAVKLRPLKVQYAKFGASSVDPEHRVDESHRQQVKALLAEGYASSQPTVEQLRSRIETLTPGTVLFAMVSTLGGFEVSQWLELLEQKDCTLVLVAMRNVPLGIVPNLGGSQRLRGYATANLADSTPRKIIDSLKG